MSRFKLLLLPSVAMATCLYLGAGKRVHAVEGAPSLATAAKLLAAARAAEPLVFEANQGQAAEDIAFLVRGRRHPVRLERDGSLIQDDLSMSLVGAAPHAAAVGLEPAGFRTSYRFGSDRSRWQSGVPSFAKVQYKEIYAGVNLTYYRNSAAQLEYDFVVAPGADPRKIRMAFKGARSLRIADDGELMITKADGSVTLHTQPAIYQSSGGARTPVRGRYEQLNEHTVGFRIARFDHHRPLVIDPTVVDTTPIKGNNDDQPVAIAVDSSGNSYITGITASTVGFPVGQTTSSMFPTSPPKDCTHPQPFACPNEAFVMVLSPTGSIMNLAYFGGTGYTYPTAIAIDSSNFVYVAGSTTSTTFTDSAGNVHGYSLNQLYGTQTIPGSDVSFLAKFAPLNLAMESSVTAGATDGQASEAHGLAIDPQNNVYMAGSVCGAGFPTSAVAKLPVIQAQNGGGCDAYVLKFDASGNMKYGTYLGGSGFDYATAVAVDVGGSAWITGQTCSTNFPITSIVLSRGSPGTTNDGCVGFVAELLPDGSGLQYAVTFGGAPLPNTVSGGITYPYDEPNAIVINGSNGVYIAGTTTSTNFMKVSPAGLPTPTPIASQSMPCHSDGCESAFVLQVNSGFNMPYATYLGGPSPAQGLAIAARSTGEIYVSGETNDYHGFPGATSASPQSAYGFVSRLPATLASVSSTNLAGGYIFGVTSRLSTQSQLPARYAPTLIYTVGVDLVSAAATTKGDALQDGFVDIFSEPSETPLPPIGRL